MELVYLWVEEYKNIHKQGFNFSPRFNCEYDPKTNKLTIDENDDYIENFFGKNINVTAIVGKNGSGKSAIIDSIINDIIYSDKIDYNPQGLYCYLNDSKDEIYINSHLLAESQVKSTFPYKMTHINSQYDISDYVSSAFMYEVKQLERFREEYNKSFFYLYNYSLESDNFLHKDYIYNEELLFHPEINKLNDKINLEAENDKINNYLLGIFLNQDRLAKELNEVFEPTKIFLDRKIFVNYFNKDLNEEESYRSFLQNAQIEEIIKLETLIFLREYISSHKFHFHFEKEIAQLQEKFYSQNLIENYDEALYEVESHLKEMVESVRLTKGEIRFDDNKNNDYYLENLIELEKILHLLEHSSDIALLIKNIRNDPYYDYELNINMLTKENIDRLKKLPLYLSVDFANKKSVKFSELSSGEQNLLKIIFSIENIIQLRKERTDNYYILLDEIENTFHPSWQKKIINWLVNFLKNYKSLQFNIIITSHSPFLISDLPEENIIFLKDGKNDKGTKHKQTFGANIHTLLSDSFFMDDGLMGEFAKGKIEEVIDFLRKDIAKNEFEDSYTPLNLEQVESIISIVGEPLLQARLKKMLIDYKKRHDLLTASDLEQQIEELQAQLSEMRHNG